MVVVALQQCRSQKATNLLFTYIFTLLNAFQILETQQVAHPLFLKSRYLERWKLTLLRPAPIHCAAPQNMNNIPQDIQSTCSALD
jgi:hypothetical protein